MADELTVARSELILGGQRSGKSRRAESLALAWLADAPGRRAVMIATGQPWDDEMRERIERHKQDRAERLPAMKTVEEPLMLPEAIARHSKADTLIVVDCLTLWLTAWLMPMEGVRPGLLEPEDELRVKPANELRVKPEHELRVKPEHKLRVKPAMTASDVIPDPIRDPRLPAAALSNRQHDVPYTALAQSIRESAGPVILVSNEIGLGVVPMGREVRAFVDAQGRLNQDMARLCKRVTLMAAGLPVTMKDAA